MNSRTGFNVAIGGITTAFVVLSLYGGTLVMNNKLFFMTAATYISVIPYLTGGIKQGIIVYLSSFILSFILIPNKFYAAGYVFLGIYPLIKLVCERFGTLNEFIYKYIWFNLTLTILYLLFKNAIYLNQSILNSKAIIIIIISMQVFFLIYDYLFTKVIIFLEDKIIRKII